MKHRISALGNLEKYKEKYHAIEKELSLQYSKIQQKELQIAQIEKEMFAKDEQIRAIRGKLDRERAQFESERINSKKKYAKKLEDCRDRARQMLEEKDKQLLLLQNVKNNTPPSSNTNDIKIINNNYNYQMNVKYDKETQTVADEYISESEQHAQQHQTVEGMVTEEEEDEKKNDSGPDAMAASNITIIYHQKQKIKAFEERLKRLKELLAESEEQHKRKNVQLESLKASSNFGIENVEMSLNHSEYLKNALLQYFDGKISVHQLLSVVTVGLRLSDNEQKKAKNSKLLLEQATKSWWG